MRNAYSILVEKSEEKRPLGRPRRGLEITLECIFRKQGGRVWTGCIWLRIETSGGFF
jgi:hypothetical protein